MNGADNRCGNRGGNRGDVHADTRVNNLILRSQRGDLEAFEELVRLFQGRVARLATYIVGPENAEDAVQDVFVRVYRSLPGYRFRASFSTWLYRVALNICYDRLRSQKRRRVQEVSLEERRSFVESQGVKAVGGAFLTSDAMIEKRELEIALKECLARLSDKHRDVLVLHDIEGLTYDEISAVVGCLPGTVKSRLFYARSQLRELLASYLGG